MHVRQATPADAGDILDCLHAAFDPYRDRYTPGAFSDTVPESLDERFRTMILFVAVDDAAIVGTIACAVHGREGHLRGMAVRPEKHGAGAARMLLQAAEDAFRARGCERVTLDTTEPLQRARAFYEKCGYRRTGRTSDFYGMTLTEFAKTLSTT